jgi:hypothetical protein
VYFIASVVRLTMSIQCSEKELPHVLTQIGRLSDAIKAEFDLIGTRMIWLVTSQSFLFAAFAATVSSLKGDKPFLTTTVRYLIGALPTMGVVFSGIVAVAIYAAQSAITKLKNGRDEMMATLPPNLQVRLISVADIEHKRGNLPPRYIPLALGAAWIGAVLSLPMPPW